MALDRITNPPLTDGTGATMVQKLEAIKNALQPTNAGIDIDVLIPASGWSNESPYTYTYSNAHITSGALVKVTFLEGSGNSGAPKFIYGEKVTGGVRFEANTKPTTDISVRLHIFSADTTSTAATTADEVSTSAVSGANNVEDALGSLNSKIVALEGSKLASMVDISSYNTSSNRYTFPSDGFVEIVNNSGVEGYATVSGSSSGNTFSIGKATGRFSCFVKKGMRIFINVPATGSAFYPLS